MSLLPSVPILNAAHGVDNIQFVMTIFSHISPSVLFKTMQSSPVFILQSLITTFLHPSGVDPDRVYSQYIVINRNSPYFYIITSH